MAYLVGLPLLFLLAIVQSAVLTHLRLLDGRPDLILLAVVGWALTGRWREAMGWGLAGGLLLDLLSGAPFGSSAIGLILVALLVSLTEGRFWEAHLLMPLGAMLVASVVFYAIGIMALVLSGQQPDLIESLTRIILPGLFLNLLLAIPAAQLSQGLCNLLFPPEVRI